LLVAVVVLKRLLVLVVVPSVVAILVFPEVGIVVLALLDEDDREVSVVNVEEIELEVDFIADVVEMLDETVLELETWVDVAKDGDTTADEDELGIDVVELDKLDALGCETVLGDFEDVIKTVEKLLELWLDVVPFTDVVVDAETARLDDAEPETIKLVTLGCAAVIKVDVLEEGAWTCKELEKELEEELGEELKEELKEELEEELKEELKEELREELEEELGGGLEEELEAEQLEEELEESLIRSC